MDDIERLTAIEEIRRLKARYFRCLDTKDWDGFRDVFASDAEMDMRAEAGDRGLVHGSQDIADFVRGVVGDVQTGQLGDMGEIELTSTTTATGIWAMEDLLRWPAGGPYGSMHGWGHYHETYAKQADAWRIQTLTLTRLRLDFD